MFEWEDGMDEISGMGGGYEDECRAMLKRGLEWLYSHPNADPKYHGFKDVYGIIIDDNEDAKELDKAVCGCDCTGAMHQAVISHIFFIRKNGWEKYVEEMKRR